MKSRESIMRGSADTEISFAVIDDAEGIQSLIRESSNGMYELCGWSQEEISDHFSSTSDEVGIEKIRNSIANFTEADILIVAKDEKGKIIGCCFAEKQKDTNKIEAVYISKDFQGIGLGKKLFDEANNKLNPDTDTVLEVFSQNSKAINFYKKLGFSETGKKFFDKKYADSKGNMLEISEMLRPVNKPNQVAP